MLPSCARCDKPVRGPGYTLCEEHFKGWLRKPSVTSDDMAEAYTIPTKIHDHALNCKEDLFDKLVDYAETRHKDWNKVFANCLREMNDRLKEIQAAVDRMETRGLL